MTIGIVAAGSIVAALNRGGHQSVREPKAATFRRSEHLNPELLRTDARPVSDAERVVDAAYWPHCYANVPDFKQ